MRQIKDMYPEYERRTHVDTAHALTINSNIQIKLGKKVMNGKTISHTQKNHFVNATANGKKYFCEFKEGNWVAKNEI